MRTANINCARFIGIRNHLARAARALPALGLLLLPVEMTAAQTADAAPDEAPRINADPSFPFSDEVAAFARANEADQAAPGSILFLGSSSIRLWNTRGSFPDRGTINRGFGGATTRDVLRHYPRLLPRAAPRSILVYVGENDLAAGAPPAEVAKDALTLLRKLRGDFPGARIAYLSLKPSPIRWTLWPKMAAVNMTVAARSRVSGFQFLDVGSSLLAGDGLPDASLFRRDGLHMNARGYMRWTALVDQWLDRTQSPPEAHRALPSGPPPPRQASLSD